MRNWSLPVRMDSKYKDELKSIAEELGITFNSLIESVIISFILKYRATGSENVKITYINSERKSKIEIEEVK